jgi:orotate phosphoribosyltransferase
MSHESAKLAKFLLEIKAVKLSPRNPFTWTSGIKSPIYCDNRTVLSYPEVRNFVADSLAAMVKEHFPEVDRLAGIATAGIAHGVLAADRLNMSYCYVRPEPKKHGLKNQVEGHMNEGDKVVLIEDLVSTGKSSMQAVEGVRNEGGVVIGVLALFSYGFADAHKRFADEGIPLYTISNLNVLSEVAAKEGFISMEDIEMVQQFAKDPHSWGNV